MSIDWLELNSFTKSLAGSAWNFAVAMATIGVLSMAIIQTLKDMLPLRNWFQKWMLDKWLREKADKADRTETGIPNVIEAKKDLIRLATAGDQSAFYDLAIEQLCGQMNAAAQVMLEYPANHKDLLRCLAALADQADIDAVLTKTKPGEETLAKTQTQVDARTRIIHHVQRSIDGFQISAGFRWKWLLQVASFGTSFVLTFIGVSLYSIKGASIENMPAVMLAGLAGGFLAPVARDLVASLQKLRA